MESSFVSISKYVGSQPEKVLQEVFGYQNFRPLQKEIIQSILKHQDTLAIMPTGGGKSLCYQIPALIFEGITVIVSPLIALMQDQVQQLNQLGVNAVFMNSTLTLEEFKTTVRNIKQGTVKLLYVSPEGLATEKIKNILHESALNISAIIIDEAHCISSWGHDFRPDYLEIPRFRKEFPKAVCLALTATATLQVQTDIAESLAMKNPRLLTASFNRSNIYLSVEPKNDGLGQVMNFIKNHSGESGIIYCLSRKEVDELALALEKRKVSVSRYHAGLSQEERSENQDLFLQNKIDVMVATVAFGMGINKPNVRYVIHYSLPRSIEQYYQEIGRAGRDGKPSSALLLYSFSDAHRIRFLFKDSYNEEKSEKLLQSMLSFAGSRVCRRKILLKYFGEEYSGTNDSCCDVCNGRNITQKDVTVQAQKFLSCVYRTEQRYGASYIIDILLGSRQKRIVENHHTLISTFGIGGELTQSQWFELADSLEQAGIISRTSDYNVVKVTALGKELLQCRETIKLPVNFTIEEGKPRHKSFPKKYYKNNWSKR